jgi:hypothetical protein
MAEKLETAAADRELIRLGREYEDAIARAKEPDDDELLDVVGDEEARIAEQIIERRATTIGGLRVKARVVAEWTLPFREDVGLDNTAVISLVNDLLAQGEDVTLSDESSPIGKGSPD